MATQEIKDAVKAHNDGMCRPNHAVTPTTNISFPAARHAAQSVHPQDPAWDNNLAASALTWAKHLASIDQLVHEGKQGQGENLFMQMGGVQKKVGVESWVNEKKNYHGEKIGEGNFASYGHYTHLHYVSFPFPPPRSSSFCFMPCCHHAGKASRSKAALY